MHNQFEYEERYKVSDLISTQLNLEVNGFELSGHKVQTDHWFIPKYIMSAAEQAQWFDYDRGYALRLREETVGDLRKVIITSKQILYSADHSAMTNNEAELSTQGLQRVLAPLGSEFDELIQTVAANSSGHSLTLAEAKHLIENAGRKDYIVINKLRATYHNTGLPDITADIDSVPDLANTSLGFSAAIELEYNGSGSLDEAKAAVRSLSTRLGYKQADILAMALPGLAIKYLAVF